MPTGRNDSNSSAIYNNPDEADSGHTPALQVHGDLRVATVGLRNYFPRRAWAAIAVFTAVAGAALFVPPTAGSAVGLEPIQHVALAAGVELAAALGVIGVVLYYHDDAGEPDTRDDWEHEP